MRREKANCEAHIRIATCWALGLLGPKYPIPSRATTAPILLCWRVSIFSCDFGCEANMRVQSVDSACVYWARYSDSLA